MNRQSFKYDTCLHCINITIYSTCDKYTLQPDSTLVIRARDVTNHNNAEIQDIWLSFLTTRKCSEFAYSESYMSHLRDCCEIRKS